MTATNVYSLALPTVNGDSDAWGTKLNNLVITASDLLFSIITTGGSANAYTLTSGLSYGAYVSGMTFMIKASFGNTGAATLNLDGISAKALTKNGTTALVSGDIVSGTIYRVAYDGTQFQIMTALPGAFQPLDATLTAFAALTISAGTYIRGTGADAFSVDSYATVLSNIGAQASLGYTAANDSLAAHLAGTETFTGKKTMSGVDFVLDTGGPTSTVSAGYRGAPAVGTPNSAYTMVLADAGGTLYHDEVTARTWVIPANASVAFPIGTVIILDNTGNSGAAGALTLTISSDTLRRGDGTAGTGSRTIAASAVAVIRKTKSTEWVITGSFT